MTHKSSACGNPAFFSSLKKNPIIAPVREKARLVLKWILKKGRQITHHCQFEGLCWAWRRHMEGMTWRGSLSLLPSETRWFLHFTSTSNSLRIIRACVNNQSNEGLWPTERKAQSLEVELIFCTRGEQVLEPAVLDGRGCFSVGKCSLYRCPPDITGRQGGQGTGWDMSGQRSFTETDGPSLRKLKYLPQQENRLNAPPSESAQHSSKWVYFG